MQFNILGRHLFKKSRRKEESLFGNGVLAKSHRLVEAAIRAVRSLLFLFFFFRFSDNNEIGVVVVVVFFSGSCDATSRQNSVPAKLRHLVLNVLPELFVNGREVLDRAVLDEGRGLDQGGRDVFRKSVSLLVGQDLTVEKRRLTEVVVVAAVMSRDIAGAETCWEMNFESNFLSYVIRH